MYGVFSQKLKYACSGLKKNICRRKVTTVFRGGAVISSHMPVWRRRRWRCILALLKYEVEEAAECGKFLHIKLSTV
jgi:hypothetical protein